MLSAVQHRAADIGGQQPGEDATPRLRQHGDCGEDQHGAHRAEDDLDDGFDLQAPRLVVLACAAKAEAEQTVGGAVDQRQQQHEHQRTIGGLRLLEVAQQDVAGPDGPVQQQVDDDQQVPGLRQYLYRQTWPHDAGLGCLQVGAYALTPAPHLHTHDAHQRQTGSDAHQQPQMLLQPEQPQQVTGEDAEAGDAGQHDHRARQPLRVPVVECEQPQAARAGSKQELRRGGSEACQRDRGDIGADVDSQRIEALEEQVARGIGDDAEHQQANQREAQTQRQQAAARGEAGRRHGLEALRVPAHKAAQQPLGDQTEDKDEHQHQRRTPEDGPTLVVGEEVEHRSEMSWGFHQCGGGFVDALGDPVRAALHYLEKIAGSLLAGRRLGTLAQRVQEQHAALRVGQWRDKGLDVGRLEISR